MKSIADFERERGILFTNVEDPTKQVTESEFDELMADPSKWTGVNHDDRVKFLKANGYEVTRENLADPSLSAVQGKKS